VNIFEEPEEVVVLAQMPGADEESINCKIEDDILLVYAEAKDTCGTKRYEKEILLPFIVCPDSLKTSYENQILEIKLTKSQKEKNKKTKSPNSGSIGQEKGLT
jgi:HSP20 family protein